MTSRTGSEGFTFIEVLVATVILFAGLAAVLKAYSAAVNALAVEENVRASTDLLAAQAASLEWQWAIGNGAAPLPGRLSRDGVDYDCEVAFARTPLSTSLAADHADLLVRRVGYGEARGLACDWVTRIARDTRDTNGGTGP